jgi:hypothetical protein
MTNTAKQLSFYMAIICFLIAGCATTSLERASIVVTEGGSITIKGRDTPLKKICSTLRSAGATRNTHIVVRLPSNTSASLRTSIYSTLVQGGFPAILLQQQKKPEAYITKERARENRKKVQLRKPLR